MTEPSDNRLYLDDRLLKWYGHLDKDGDRALVPEEVGSLSDLKLAEVLNNAHVGKNERQEMGYNNHHAFFNALPHRRIASLFASEFVHAHYLRAAEKMPMSDFGHVLAEILKDKSEKSYLTADRFIATARIFVDQWDEIFAAAGSECKDYIDSRTAVSFHGFKYADRALKWDADGNGVIESKELEEMNLKEESYPLMSKLAHDLMQILPMFVEAANSPQQRLAVSYILGSLDPMVLYTMSLAIFDKMHTADRPGDDESDTITPQMLGGYFNVRLLFNPQSFLNELLDIIRIKGPEVTASYMNTVEQYVSDEAREILDGMPQFVVVTVELPPSTETEPAPTAEHEPYKIDGIEMATKDNFDDKVLGEKTDPVMVIFGASYCPTCKIVKSVVQEIKRDYGNAMHIYTVDTWASQELSEKYSISGIPTFMLFRNGEIVMQISGLDSAEGNELKQTLQRLYPKSIQL